MADDQIRGLRWAYVLMGVADGTLLPFIPLYLLQRGMSASGIGLVLAASALAALAGGLGWAYLADRRVSPERLLVMATVASAAAGALIVVPGSAAALGKGRQVHPQRLGVAVGARAVFEFRGEIVTVPASKGDPHNLTETPGIHERSPISTRSWGCA